MKRKKKTLCDLYSTFAVVARCALQSSIWAERCENSTMQRKRSLMRFKQPEMFPAYVNQLAVAI